MRPDPDPLTVDWEEELRRLEKKHRDFWLNWDGNRDSINRYIVQRIASEHPQHPTVSWWRRLWRAVRRGR